MKLLNETYEQVTSAELRALAAYIYSAGADVSGSTTTKI